MELIPAIDILGGRVVRLHQGDYDAVTVYDQDPLASAVRFEDSGAKLLHVVDLDAARTGAAVNHEVVSRIVRGTKLKVQVGGGVRSRAVADAWFDVGAARVVVGTAAVTEPAWVESLCLARPSGVVVAIDARAGKVAVSGWTTSTDVLAPDLARRVDAWGAAAILFTVIERDGTREGPDVEATVALQTGLRADVIASGGIGTLDHVTTLAQRGVRSAVCGRALYSGAFTYEDAMKALAKC